MKFLFFFFLSIIASDLYPKTSAEIRTKENLIYFLLNVDRSEVPEVRLMIYENAIDEYVKNNNLGHSLEETEVADKGEWDAFTSKDPITDEVIAYFMAEAEQHPKPYVDAITLVLRHQGSRYEMYIVWGKYLGTDNIPITFRIGQEEPKQLDFNISTDHKAAFLPYDAKDLIKKIIKNDRFIARCTPYGENPITATFNIKGLSKAAEPYLFHFKDLIKEINTEESVTNK